ncbi:putative enzyme related to lactoylglutathione lyase [Sporosarcina luteola]|nr:putative enzyme related to lactoylglutathione lyase [Sporosarcina luteola]
MSHSINKIGQIAVPVKNFERAVSFYENVLGLPKLFETGHLAFFDCGGVRLLLSPPEKEEFANASSIIYFHVEHIEEAYTAYKEAGVLFTDEPHVIAKMGQTETWMVFFRDSENNTLAFMSEKIVSE